MHQISVCESLLNCDKIDRILKRMVTGGEKWVTYDNRLINSQESFVKCLVELAGKHPL